MTQRTPVGFENATSTHAVSVNPANLAAAGASTFGGQLGARFTAAVAKGTGLRVSLETGLWLILLLGAAVSRFWDLGYRALHHDESLHAYYSWVFSNGSQPYVHHPLMHGPFLFHLNALVYLLFGASDATSRFAPALAGVLIVGLPWLLRDRRFLGPWGALSAGIMLTISPSFLYYTRYIRHDPYTALGSLLLAIAIIRYLQTPQRKWMLTAFVSVAFLFTNHEIVYAILLGFVLILWGALLWGRLRPLVPVHLVAVGALGLVLVLKKAMGWSHYPAIPWENASQEETARFYEHVLTNPFTLSVLLVGIGFVAASVVVLKRHYAKAARTVGYREAILGGTNPGTVEYGLNHALADWHGLLLGAGIALFIAVALFTTLFTNLHGIATMTYAPDGTLLYWLGQQGVQRGEQPWFYFITESVQYEWLAIALGLGSLVLVAIRTVQIPLTGKTPTKQLLGAFFAGWFGFLFLVLSWAGEKMPWLIMHFTLPAILLGALLVQEVVEGVQTWWGRHRPRRLGILADTGWGVVLSITLIVLAGGWVFLAAKLTAGVWVQTQTGWVRETPTWAAHDWWLLAVPPVVALGLIGLGLVVVGRRIAVYATLAATLVVLSLFQVHAGFRLAYLNGDTAIDTMIYNTTSPDTTQLTHDLQEMSELIYGDRSMSVAYDSGCVQWPLNWYMRNLPNAFMTSDPSSNGGPNGTPVIITQPNGGSGCLVGDTIDGYTGQWYVLRWHEPEQAIYRNFAIAPEIPVGRSAWTTVTQPHGLVDILGSVMDGVSSLSKQSEQIRDFRLLMYREMPEGTNGYMFKVYIRNDLLPYYNDVRYGK